MVHTQHLHVHLLCGCVLLALALDLSNGHDWDDDLLEHCPAMHEPGPAREMKPVATSGDIKLHLTGCSGSSFCPTVEGLVDLGKVVPQQISLLGDHGSLGLFLQLALLDFGRSRIAVEKPVIGRDHYIRSVQVVDDVSDYLAHLIDGFPGSMKRFAL